MGNRGEARRGEKGGGRGEGEEKKRERERKGATGLVCGLLDFKPSPPRPPPPLQRTACLFLQFALYVEDRQLDFLAFLRCSATV